MKSKSWEIFSSLSTFGILYIFVDNILIKLYKNNSLEDMIKYLQFRDDTILIKPREDKKEITKNISSSKKKSTNKKKK